MNAMAFEESIPESQRISLASTYKKDMKMNIIANSIKNSR